LACSIKDQWFFMGSSEGGRFALTGREFNATAPAPQYAPIRAKAPRLTRRSAFCYFKIGVNVK
jgi:hypothetical protein